MVYRLAHWFMEPPDEAPPFAVAILDRFPVGAIFLIEGILKFHLPQEFGVGRFATVAPKQLDGNFLGELSPKP